MDDMFDATVYSVGARVCSPSNDMVMFDLTDGGGLLLVKMGHPTAKEKRSFKDPTSFRFLVVDDVIMVLVRLGLAQWMDAPYYRYDSLQLTHTEFPEDGEGLAIHAMLIDAATGILVAQKLFSPDTATSQAFLTAVRMQPQIPNYHNRVAQILAKYTTNDLVAIWEAQNG